MRIFTEHSEERLAAVLESVNKDHDQWINWVCLHIESADLSGFRDNPDLMLSAEMMIEEALSEYDGDLYFCGQEDIFMFSRDLTEDFMVEIGRQACEDLLGEAAASARLRTYNLGQKGYEFAYSVYGKGMQVKMTATRAQKEHHRAREKAREYISAALQGRIENRQDVAEFPFIRVLLIEDDSVCTRMVARALRGQCELLTVPNMSQAYEVFARKRPHLVFLDIGLPDGNGLQLIRWMKRYAPDVYVVMLSGEASLSNIMESVTLGADGFISKPFRRRALVDHVAAAQHSG